MSVDQTCNSRSDKKREAARGELVFLLALSYLMGGGSAAYAFSIDTADPDWKVRWDNTVKYSAAFRTRDRSGNLSSDPNQDDGDRNFNTGLISNRLDVLSELDASFRNQFGVRFSGAGWYDSVYNSSNDNNSPATVNHFSTSPNTFAHAARDIEGRYTELLDGFAYAGGDLAGMPVKVRAGRHTLIYGETLFFGANGIAYAQSPTDLIKLLSVPSSQFKEILLPVNQISGDLQILPNVSVGAYYQFEWREDRLPASGSYFSSVDVLGAGAEQFVFGPGGPYARRLADERGRNSGQGGVQVRWRPELFPDVELGFYAVRYNDKLPQVYLRPVGLVVPGFPINYQQVYPNGITSYGVSFSTDLGGANIAGEASYRHHTPLVAGPVVDPTPAGVGDNRLNRLYPVGDSAHVNLSTIVFLGRSKLWNDANLLGEVAWNGRVSTSLNPAQIDPNTSRQAYGIRFIFTPSWFGVLPGFDVSAPLGVGFNPQGNSSVVQNFNGGVTHGGDVSIGINGVYRQVWRSSLTYTGYYGKPGTALGPDANLTFRQSLADRNFISLSLQRTF
jgi:hypothetical protein